MDVDKGVEVLSRWLALSDLPDSDPICLALCVEQIVTAATDD